jgi:hypothetical protein
VDSLALVFSSGWASGINAYLVVLVLGIAERFGETETLPDALGRTDVLAAAGVLFAIEFVADKIPIVDSGWDTISTAIRPTIGAILGVLLAGEVDGLEQALTGAVGGSSALASHAVKAGVRLAINASPEPFSNIAASLTEDATVLAVVWFAIEHPETAAVIAGALLAVGLVALYFVSRLIRRGLRRLRDGRRVSDEPH